MRARASVLWNPKAGNGPAEFEDAYMLVPPPADGDTYDDGFRVVACDGATVGYLAGRWARTLADAYGRAPEAALAGRDGFLAAVGSEVEAWPSRVRQYVSEREADGEPLQWHEMLALDRPIASTLLALDVRLPRPPDPQPALLALLARFRQLVVTRLRGVPASRPAGSWRAVAVGDTNLFQVRDDALAHAFPVRSGDAFGDTPALIATSGQSPDTLSSSVRFADGSLIPGDRLYLCTDALAAWFLQCHERRERPWARLDAITASTFPGWLDDARATGDIRNDDVTLVRVVVL